MISFRSARNAMIALATFAGTAQAQAGLLSNIAVVTINATKPTSLTVLVNSGGNPNCFPGHFKLRQFERLCHETPLPAEQEITLWRVNGARLFG